VLLIGLVLVVSTIATSAVAGVSYLLQYCNDTTIKWLSAAVNKTISAIQRAHRSPREDAACCWCCAVARAIYTRRGGHWRHFTLTSLSRQAEERGQAQSI